MPGRTGITECSGVEKHSPTSMVELESLKLVVGVLGGSNPSATWFETKCVTFVHIRSPGSRSELTASDFVPVSTGNILFGISMVAGNIPAGISSSAGVPFGLTRQVTGTWLESNLCSPVGESRANSRVSMAKAMFRPTVRWSGWDVPAIESFRRVSRQAWVPSSLKFESDKISDHSWSENLASGNKLGP